MRTRIQGFDDQNLKNITSEKVILFLIKNCNFFYPEASKKDVQATERPSAKKREHPALKASKDWRISSHTITRFNTLLAP
jgi:hypothetical protein